jgi:sugar lactone lactonase YvrE
MASARMMTATISNSATLRLCSVVLAVLVCWSAAEAASPGSRQLTPPGEYTFGIEGPAADRAGNVYVVNFQRQGTIGIVMAEQSASQLFLSLPEGSIGNSIRFDSQGRMFVADYKKHNIFVMEKPGGELRTYFHADEFNQPNDMAVAPDGTIYASDPSWKQRSGQVWRVVRGPQGNGIGERMTADRVMSTTNGIDLSPDGKTLYVGESDTREIWAYRLDGARLVAPRLVRRFSDYGIDGIRTDIDGRLYVARILKGAIAVLSADGKIQREIPLTAKEPTNLAFGGSDGRTVFVTQRQGGFLETFRVARPGREFCLQVAECPSASADSKN